MSKKLKSLLLKQFYFGGLNDSSRGGFFLFFNCLTDSICIMLQKFWFVPSNGIHLTVGFSDLWLYLTSWWRFIFPQEVSLQQTAQPTSTIVRPASLQVPNVLLTSSDSSVIIQQAIPSPTSSTVITQAPSSNRPIV